MAKCSIMFVFFVAVLNLKIVESLSRKQKVVSFHLLQDISQRLNGSTVDVQKADSVLLALNQATDMHAHQDDIKAWRKAQQKVLDKFSDNTPLPFFRKGSEGSNLYDKEFFHHFIEKFDNDPTFFLGLVYLPVKWHAAVEGNPKSLVSVIPILESLPLDFKYFTVMSQSHVGQAEQQFKKYGSGRRSTVQWKNILVFDSRGRDLDTVVEYPRVPIPLLYKAEKELEESKQINKDEVFFSGHCHWEIARQIIGKKVPSGRHHGDKYNWVIKPCDKTISYDHFKEHLQKSTWAITPEGSMPASFAMYEALQAGALVILPYSEFKDHTHHGVNHEQKHEKFLWLPYRNINVRWQSELAELMPVSELSSLKRRIEEIPEDSVKERQRILKKMQPLFRAEGLNAYILHMASFARKAEKLFASFSEGSALGRGVAFYSRVGQL